MINSPICRPCPSPLPALSVSFISIVLRNRQMAWLAKTCRFGRLRCVEIQVRPSRKWWLARTGAERTKVREHRKRRKPLLAGRPHLNIGAS
ncbi:hypothetical protein FJ471_24970 [Mesorhizobium sp. B2-7-1]|nr:hypothetical protein FJ471_24970 [Mesorhizobium sp. B2-7-1]